MFLNTTIIYDLMQVIENPFKSSEQRIPKYLLVSFAAAIVFSFTGHTFSSSMDVKFQKYDDYTYMFVALANSIFGTFSVVWLTKRFKKPGMSGELKREIRSRYVVYIVLYVLFQWPVMHLTQP